jgi:AbrB family looped-hinge helix DNA binding protein
MNAPRRVDHCLDVVVRFLPVRLIPMRITSKGQVTIPQHIREKLGLHPETEVEFTVERGAAVIRPKKGTPDRVDRMMTALRNGPKMRMSSKELLALLRDPPDEIDAD